VRATGYCIGKGWNILICDLSQIVTLRIAFEFVVHAHLESSSFCASRLLRTAPQFVRYHASQSAEQGPSASLPVRARDLDDVHLRL